LAQGLLDIIAPVAQTPYSHVQPSHEIFCEIPFGGFLWKILISLNFEIHFTAGHVTTIPWPHYILNFYACKIVGTWKHRCTALAAGAGAQAA
jgi:hypothetical protein